MTLLAIARDLKNDLSSGQTGPLKCARREGNLLQLITRSELAKRPGCRGLDDQGNTSLEKNRYQKVVPIFESLAIAYSTGDYHKVIAICLDSVRHDIKSL